MARHRDEACVFCGASPCECNAQKKAPAPTSKRAAGRQAPREVPTNLEAPARPKISALKRTPAAPAPAVRTSPGSSTAPEPQVKRSQVTARTIRTQEETELRAAITAFAAAELLSVETLKEQRPRIDLPSWKVDALIWKQGG